MARYANWHSDQAESLMSVGSNPTRATRRGTEFAVPWSNGDDTSLTKRKRGFDSLRDDSVKSRMKHDGPRVRRRHPFLVRRGTEFDSRADLCRWSTDTGCWSNGKTPGLQPGDRGSTPRWSTEQKRAHGPKGRHQAGSLKIRVRFPVGPLNLEGRRIWLAAPLC